MPERANGKGARKKERKESFMQQMPSVLWRQGMGIDAEIIRRLEALQIWRRILKVLCIDRITNLEILRRLNFERELLLINNKSRTLRYLIS